jgi:hypothetical protein
MSSASVRKVIKKSRKRRVGNMNGDNEVTITYGARQRPTDRYYSQVPKPIKKTAVVKYIDNYYLSNSATSTLSYFVQSDPPQGISQSQRTGDTIWLRDLEFKASFLQYNADVVSHVRLFFFLWKQNNASTVPSTGSIMENPSSFSVYSPLNFEGRAYYKMCYDYLVPLAGTTTNPTAISCVDKTEMISLDESRVDFLSGTTSGVGLLYVCWYSDSSISPNPLISLVTRTWYYDSD